MKNHELLDMIGEVNEDYVLAADTGAARPRFRWKTFAACAACAALVLGAYPSYQAINQLYKPLDLRLHGYTVVEGGGTLDTLEDVKAPAGGIDVPGQNAPAPNPDQLPLGDGPSIMPEGAYVGGDAGPGGIDGQQYSVPGQDAPIQEKAAAQYDNLMKNGSINAAAPNPDWYGGAWIDNSYYPEAKLAVAIVEGFRTPELELQIEEWCGGEVVFQDAKYALAYLYALQDLVVDVITGGHDALSCGIGVDVTANCLGVDIYSDGAAVPDGVLAELARLDPDGDAIRVQLFTGKLNTLTDEIVKGPAPNSAAPSVPSGARAEPSLDGQDVPAEAGVSPVPRPEELPAAKETSMPALTENG